MGVSSVTENFTGLAAHDRTQPDGRIMGDMRRFFVVTFDEADDPYLRPILALSDGRVPQIGQPLPGYPWIYVLDRRAAVANKSAFVYRVTIQYSEIKDPTAEPARIEWFSARTMKPVYVGRDDDGETVALLTSSDEPFDPPPMNECDDLVLRATYSTETFDPVVAHNFKNAINNRPIWIRGYPTPFPAGASKVMVYTARENRAIADAFYFDVQVEIHFRKTGWKRRFPDLGFRTKESIDDGVQTYKNITDTAGNEITEPVMLDGRGQQGSSLLMTYGEYWLNDRLDFASVFPEFLS